MINITYLFNCSCLEAVALADDGGASATSNSVLPPSLVIIVHHMTVPKAAPTMISMQSINTKKAHMHNKILGL